MPAAFCQQRWSAGQDRRWAHPDQLVPLAIQLNVDVILQQSAAPSFQCIPISRHPMSFIIDASSFRESDKLEGVFENSLVGKNINVGTQLSVHPHISSPDVHAVIAVLMTAQANQQVDARAELPTKVLVYTACAPYHVTTCCQAHFLWHPEQEGIIILHWHRECELVSNMQGNGLTGLRWASTCPEGSTPTSVSSMYSQSVCSLLYVLSSCMK